MANLMRHIVHSVAILTLVGCGRADDRTHDERVGKSERQLAQCGTADLDAHPRASFHPLAIGQRGDVQVVVDDVERRDVVFVVKAPTYLQLLPGRVQRDIPLAAAFEDGDVFWLGG